MKRLLYILLIIVLNLSLVVGCIPPNEPLGPEVPIVGELKLSQEQMMVDAEGGEFSVDVFTEYSYETTTNADWITTSGGSCGPDYCTLYFTVAKNNSGAEREGVITFFCDDYNLSATLTIVQEAGSEQGSDTSIPNNQIWYTSSNGEIVTPYATDVFGANIVSNTYENGKGVITFDNDASSIGDAAFAYCSSLTSVTIPDSITSIGEYAFYGCTSLTSITIPESVTSIGNSAFYYCTGELIINSKVVETNYTGSDYPASDYNWLYGSNFTKVTIGDNISQIGKYAFYNYESLKNVTILNGVTRIRGSSFRGCISLTNIIIPGSITEIAGEAFRYCTSLTSITIPNSVTKIGNEAFRDCTSLTSVYCKPTTPPTGNDYMFDDNASDRKIYVPAASVDSYKVASYWKNYADYIYPDSGEVLENNVIYYTSNTGAAVQPYATGAFGANIVSNTYENGYGVIIFDGPVTSIGDNAFRSCSSLTSITIPDSVTSIESSAFRDCSSLTSVTIPNSVTSIGDYAFYGCSGRLIIDSKVVEKDRPNWSSPTWLAGSNFTEIVIGDSITKIGSTAFYDYQNIRSLTIGNNVTEIGKDAFSECHNIETINLGTNLTNIGNYAFNKNFSLTSVTIPESVTSIGYEAFNECTSLAHVYCKPTTPPTGNSYMFDDNASGRKIYVPRNSVDAYKSAQYWKDYKSYIVGYDF